jgi:hypothetical protein
MCKIFSETDNEINLTVNFKRKLNLPVAFISIKF